MAGIISNVIGIVRSIFSKTFKPVRKHLCQGCQKWMLPDEIGVTSRGLGYHSIQCAENHYRRVIGI